MYGNAAVFNGNLILGPTAYGTQFSAMMLPDDLLSQSNVFSVEMWVNTLPVSRPVSRPGMPARGSALDNSCFLHLGGGPYPAAQYVSNSSIVKGYAPTTPTMLTGVFASSLADVTLTEVAFIGGLGVGSSPGLETAVTYLFPEPNSPGAYIVAACDNQILKMVQITLSMRGFALYYAATEARVSSNENCYVKNVDDMSTQYFSSNVVPVASTATSGAVGVKNLTFTYQKKPATQFRITMLPGYVSAAPSLIPGISVLSLADVALGNVSFMGGGLLGGEFVPGYMFPGSTYGTYIVGICDNTLFLRMVQIILSVSDCSNGCDVSVHVDSAKKLKVTACPQLATDFYSSWNNGVTVAIATSATMQGVGVRGLTVHYKQNSK